jgi:hypothetical protein
MIDFELTPDFLASTTLVRDTLDAYPDMLKGDNVDLAMAQIKRLEYLDVFGDELELPDFDSDFDCNTW